MNSISRIDDGNVGKICTCSATPPGDGAADIRGTVGVTARGRTGKCMSLTARKLVSEQGLLMWSTRQSFPIRSHKTVFPTVLFIGFVKFNFVHIVCNDSRPQTCPISVYHHHYENPAFVNGCLFGLNALRVR